MPGSNAPLPIHTNRLLLRPHSLDDYEAALALWTDPDVTRFIGGKASTPQQVWMRILNYAGLWALLGYGYWAVVEKESGAFVGEIGFARFNRDIDAAMRTAPEAGWAFVSRVHGRGYGTEALRAVTAWGDEMLAVARTVCLIDRRNVASIHVAEACGFRAFSEMNVHGLATLFFERDRRRGESR